MGKISQEILKAWRLADEKTAAYWEEVCAALEVGEREELEKKIEDMDLFEILADAKARATRVETSDEKAYAEALANTFNEKEQGEIMPPKGPHEWLSDEFAGRHLTDDDDDGTPIIFGEDITDPFHVSDTYPVPSKKIDRSSRLSVSRATPVSSGRSTSSTHSSTSSTLSTSSKGYSGSLITPYKKWCQHDGTEVIVKVGNVTFGGAAGREVERGTAVLVVDMARDASRHSDVARYCSFPTQFESLRECVVSGPPRIEIDWTDRGAPPLTKAFFEKLPKLVKKGHVIINCVGGHGRTGTALAALMIVHHKMSAEDAIKTVRKLHCEEAIESKEQVRWLCELAGLGEKDTIVPV